MLNAGIIGYPINRTLSPLIHNFMFKYHSLLGNYIKLKTIPSKLKVTVDYIKKEDFIGVNITIPYKQNILKYIDKVDKSVEDVKAINTIVNREGILYGYNTDILGFEYSFDFHNINLKFKNVALLGTGGAARACAKVISQNNPNSFVVVGRNRDKLKSFTRDFGAMSIKYETIEKLIREMDVVINATPVDFPKLIVKMKDNSIYYDLKYSIKEGFIGKIRIINGLIMLIYQGIESFYLWTGKRVPINEILKIGVLK